MEHRNGHFRQREKKIMKEHRKWVLFRQCSSSLTEKERDGLGKGNRGHSEVMAASGKAGWYRT